MLIEICANSYQSAINAQNAGAHRIELCSELAVGGITPSYGLIKKVIEKLTIPVFILIRPRSGDFTYSEEEFDIMKKDIAFCKELGCSGIVSGVLHQNHTIDIERTQALVALSSPLPFTFHRAFDWITNPLSGIQELASLGVQRVLTSGQETKAIQGVSLLQQLNDLSDLIIMPGGGVDKESILSFRKLGFKEVHLSASRPHEIISSPNISMNSPKLLSDTFHTYSSEQDIQSILKLLTDEG